MNHTFSTGIGRMTTSLIAILTLVLLVESAAALTLTLQDATNEGGDIVTASLFVTDAVGIGSFDVKIGFDPDHVAIVDVQTGELTGDSMLESEIENGTLNIAIIDLAGISGSGSIAEISCTPIAGGDTSSLTLLGGLAYNGTTFEAEEIEDIPAIEKESVDGGDSDRTGSESLQSVGSPSADKAALNPQSTPNPTSALVESIPESAQEPAGDVPAEQEAAQEPEGVSESSPEQPGFTALFCLLSFLILVFVRNGGGR
jgi:hypothetical protein